jgi:hypothetical protein
MKKLITLIILGGFFFLGINVAEAQQNEQKQEVKKEQTTQAQAPRGSGFVDADGDGICDNYDGLRPGRGLGPGNGQGLGRAGGRGLGRGQGLRNGQGQGLRLRDGSGGNCPPPAR